LRFSIPIPDDFLAVWEGMTTRELSGHFNVSEPTVEKWMRFHGVEPRYHCVFCARRVEKSKCLSQHRCAECHAKLMAGTLETPKRCGGCQETKPISHFYLCARPNKRLPVASSHCKDCSIVRRSVEEAPEVDKVVLEWVRRKISNYSGPLTCGWVQGAVGYE
jgi:hypothetical protein